MDAGFEVRGAGLRGVAGFFAAGVCLRGAAGLRAAAGFRADVDFDGACVAGVSSPEPGFEVFSTVQTYQCPAPRGADRDSGPPHHKSTTSAEIP